MKRDFSHDEQQLSLAHIAVEKLMAERLAGEAVDVYAPDFMCWLHREFYTRLPECLHWAKPKRDQVYRVEPGRLRDSMVDVGRHTPPDFATLPQFMDRFHAFYGDEDIREPVCKIVIISIRHFNPTQPWEWAGRHELQQCLTCLGIPRIDRLYFGTNRWQMSSDPPKSRAGRRA